jgi:uncharacterized membrane protein YbhN (UPF0104 family)
LFAVGLSLALIAFLDSKSVLEKLSLIPVTLWLAMLAITTLHIGIRFWRWKILLSASVNELMPGTHLAPIYLSGFALTLIPTKLGENVRALFLKERGVDFSATISVFFVERFLDLMAVSLIAMALVFEFTETGLVGSVLLLFLILALIILALLKFPLGFIRYERLQPVLNAIGNLRQMKTKEQLLVCVYSIAAWAIQSASLWLIVLFLTPSLATPSILSTSAIYCVSLLTGAISFLPGGIGVTELTAATLLETTGVQFSTALLAITACRLTTLWYAIFLGAGSYLYCSTKKARHAAGSIEPGCVGNPAQLGQTESKNAS